MRLAFIDYNLLDYTPATPRNRPLGGMQSAACYLAAALAARGHSVTFVNRTTTPGSYDGVDCMRLTAVNGAYLNAFDAVISLTVDGLALRQAGLVRPLLLWTGHDADQPGVSRLRDGAERFVWDKIVLVSDWQAKRYANAFKIKTEQIALLRNAAAPAFGRSTRHQPYFFVAKRPPVLLYSSTPFRGLDVLLKAFPLIRARVPGCEAKIYSGMAVYQTPPEQDSYRSLYELCRTTEGVHYMGLLGQDALATAMSEGDVFAYPSTFRETSCIALMEAMASGCLIVSTAFGALPETAAGFGALCEPPARPEEFAERYAQFAAQTIQDAYANPDQAAARIDEQRAFALKNYTWFQRAIDWEAFLGDVMQKPARLTVPRRNDPCPCGSAERFKHCCGASF